MRKRVVVIVAALVCGVIGAVEAVQAAVMCRNKTSSIVTVRSKGCKRGERKVNIADLLGAGVIEGAKLADGAVTEPKLAAGVAPKFLSLNVYGALVGSGAYLRDGSGALAGLHLLDGAVVNNDFSMGFTVPPDYTPGTPLVVRLLWHTSATNCGIDFGPRTISIARAGRNHLQGPAGTDGLSVVGGNVLAAPAVANQTNETLATITSPVAAENLAPGDAISFELQRVGFWAHDTCTADMVIQGLAVEYQ